MASLKSKPWRPPLAPLPEDDDTLIRRADLPRYLPIAAQTLARWAVEGYGPRMTKVGRRLVAYRAGAVREFLRSQARENTIEDHAAAADR